MISCDDLKISDADILDKNQHKIAIIFLAMFNKFFVKEDVENGLEYDFAAIAEEFECTASYTFNILLNFDDDGNLIPANFSDVDFSLLMLAIHLLDVSANAAGLFDVTKQEFKEPFNPNNFEETLQFFKNVDYEDIQRLVYHQPDKSGTFPDVDLNIFAEDFCKYRLNTFIYQNLYDVCNFLWKYGLPVGFAFKNFYHECEKIGKEHNM